MVIFVEVDRWRAERRLALRQVDVVTDNLEEAMTWVEEAVAAQTRSIALVGNAAEVLPELGLAAFVPTWSPTRPRPMIPCTATFRPVCRLTTRTPCARSTPPPTQQRALDSMTTHVQAHARLAEEGGRSSSTTATTCASGPSTTALANAFDYPGFVPAYIRPLFCEGKGPFRWVALSGDPEDIYATDEAILELFPEDEHLPAGSSMAQETGRVPGPAGAHLLAGLRRAGQRRAEVQRTGRQRQGQSAPIVIGRDHLDCGSVASPNRETEAMHDGSDAIADWPILNALINAVSGATWVSFHHGGGVGIGYSLHAGQVIVADGTPEAAARLERVLTVDPGMGVVRHVDAGYPAGHRRRASGASRCPCWRVLSSGCSCSATRWTGQVKREYLMG